MLIIKLGLHKYFTDKTVLPSLYPHTHINLLVTTARQICPARLTFPGPLTCASCCCRSRNVDYYDPIGRNPECTAEGVAEYRVILRNRISTNCVNFALPDNLELSPLFATTHRPGKEIWNRCLYNPSPGVIQFATRGGTQEGGNLLLEELRNDSDIFSIRFPGPSTRRYLNGKRTKTTTIQVNAENSYTSILSKVVRQNICTQLGKPE